MTIRRKKTEKLRIPRQPRLDAPGALHHVIGRGIERTKILQDDVDRTDSVTRLGDLCRDGQLAVYAWALMPNHFHLLVRTGDRPLFQSMKKLLTGYVVNFNRRHKRLSRKIVDLATVARTTIAREGVPESGLRSGIRRRAAVRARRLSCQIAVKGWGIRGQRWRGSWG